MSDVRLFLSTEEFDPASALIRWKTDCAWSHCGWLRKSDMWTYSAMIDGGVQWRPPNPRAKLLILTADAMDATLAIAQTKRGEKYDWLDIIGIECAKDWCTDGRFICDKLVFWSYLQLGTPLVNPNFIPIIHLTPRDILLSPYVNEEKTT